MGCEGEEKSFEQPQPLDSSVGLKAGPPAAWGGGRACQVLWSAQDKTYRLASRSAQLPVSQKPPTLVPFASFRLSQVSSRLQEKVGEPGTEAASASRLDLLSCKLPTAQSWHLSGGTGPHAATRHVRGWDAGALCGPG